MFAYKGTKETNVKQQVNMIDSHDIDDNNLHEFQDVD